MRLWDRLLTLLRMMRGSGLHYYELEESLHTALVDLANQEQRPAEEVQADLLAIALAQQQKNGELWSRWQSLSPREQEVSALTCLGYTNRQMAARMGVSPETVKGYVRQALIKYRTHSKGELRMLLGNWDFSEWAPRAQI